MSVWHYQNIMFERRYMMNRTASSALAVAIVAIATARTPIMRAAPLNAGSTARSPNPIDLLERLQTKLSEQPEIGGRFTQDWFFAECYEILGHKQKAAEFREREQAKLEQREEQGGKLRRLCREARDCRENDPAKARAKIAEARREFEKVPEAERYSFYYDLERYYVDAKEFQQALDLTKEVNKGRYCSSAMFDYHVLAAAMLRHGATKPLEEVRTIIRQLQEEDETLRQIEEIDLEYARTQALACAGLPDEAAANFERYPRYETYVGKVWRINTLAMRYIIQEYVRSGRRSAAIAFVKKHRALVPDGQTAELAVAVANAGDFPLAISLIDASGDVNSTHQLRALAVLAHRAADFALRDKLVERCRVAYRNKPPNPPTSSDAIPQLSSEFQLAILDAIFGDFTALQRIAQQSKGPDEIEAIVWMLLVAIDKPARARNPDGKTWLDGDLDLDL
ncbi:MAG: hypothetical protein JNK76_20105 [Planctomycetales bacterium]|nr:hypothetical protein [Planctomycetales bacterium]MBN8626508.1 hypothetical protein [Planctomycetota bacterium]